MIIISAWVLVLLLIGNVNEHSHIRKRDSVLAPQKPSDRMEPSPFSALDLEAIFDIIVFLTGIVIYGIIELL